MKPEWKEAKAPSDIPLEPHCLYPEDSAFVEVNELDGVDVDLEWKLVNQHYSGFVLNCGRASVLVEN